MAREESRGKRPFKIWDGFRNIRKSLVASSLKDLEIRGKEKLNISPNETVRLVLESDGTQIEDPEYFKTLPNNTTVLLLRNDEYWYPSGIDAIKTAIAAIPKIVCETIYALELQNETPSWKIMDNKGRVTVVLHWDQRNQNYRGNTGNNNNAMQQEASPSKKTAAYQQNGFGIGGGLLMENNGKRESEQLSYQHHQSVPAAYRSTPQITVIHHDAIPTQITDTINQRGRRLSKQGSSSMDAAAIHVHTSECTHSYTPQPTADNNGDQPSSPRAAIPSVHHGPSTDPTGFECDFHCCALHEEGRRIAVHKSVATSPIQECHHTPPPPPLSVSQTPVSSMSDGTRRASPKGHVRFLDTNDGSPPLLPPAPVTHSSTPVHHHHHHHHHHQQQQQQQKHAPPGRSVHQRRSDDSSESETETTVIEDDSMTSEKFLLLIDQLTGKQDKHLTVKDIGIILERLNSKIIDVERLDRDYEATDCYNWTIKATIKGDVLQELGIIYNGNYYGISEHPGYRQHDEEFANEDTEEVLEDDDDDNGHDDNISRLNDNRRHHADEEVKI